jgi:hypothetical protein
MPRTITLRRFVKFQEQDIDHIEVLYDLHQEIAFTRIFFKPTSITVTHKPAKAIAKAFPDKIINKQQTD